MFCSNDLIIPKKKYDIHVDSITESSSLSAFAEVKDYRTAVQIGRDAVIEMLDAHNECTKAMFKTMITETADTVLINEEEAKIKTLIAKFTDFTERIKKAIVDAITGLAKKIWGFVKNKANIKTKSNSEKIKEAVTGSNSVPLISSDSGGSKTDTPKTQKSKPEPPKYSGNSNDNSAWGLVTRYLSQEEIKSIGDSIEMPVMPGTFEPQHKAKITDVVKRISDASNGGGIALLDANSVPPVVRTISKILTGNSTDPKSLGDLFKDNAVDGAKTNGRIPNEQTLGSFIALRMINPTISDSDAYSKADGSSIDTIVHRCFCTSDSEQSILESDKAENIFNYGEESDDKFLNGIAKTLEDTANKIKSYKPANYVESVMNKLHVYNSTSGKTSQSLTIKTANDTEFKILSSCQKVVSAYFNAIIISCTQITALETTKKNKARDFGDKIASAVLAKKANGGE